MDPHFFEAAMPPYCTSNDLMLTSGSFSVENWGTADGFNSDFQIKILVKN